MTLSLKICPKTYIREFLYILGPRGAKHESLAIRPNLPDDLAYLRLETHVKHTVGFIKNEVSNTLKVGLATLEHVNQPAWCGDGNLNTTLQVSNLGAFGGAAIDGGITDPRVGPVRLLSKQKHILQDRDEDVPEFGAFLLYLHCKLASWG
jgi:hypothetical protein